MQIERIKALAGYLGRPQMLDWTAKSELGTELIAVTAAVESPMKSIQQLGCNSWERALSYFCMIYCSQGSDIQNQAIQKYFAS